MSRVSPPLETAFWKRVDRRGDDECWPWLGSRNRAGYGTLYREGRNVRASRVAWSLANKSPFPAELFACHSCDNPSCVNPTHIWPGTAKDNAVDKVLKGRHRGNSNPIICRNGHVRLAEHTRVVRGRLCCMICRRAGKARRRRASRPRPVNASIYGHGKLCVRCGHHRTDDYPEKCRGKPIWRCRKCNHNRSAANHKARRAAKK